MHTGRIDAFCRPGLTFWLKKLWFQRLQPCLRPERIRDEVLALVPPRVARDGRCCSRTDGQCRICAGRKSSAHGADSGPKCCQRHACPQRTPAGPSRAGSAHEYGNDHSTRPKDRPAAWRGGSSREGLSGRGTS